MEEAPTQEGAERTLRHFGETRIPVITEVVVLNLSLCLFTHEILL